MFKSRVKGLTAYIFGIILADLKRMKNLLLFLLFFSLFAAKAQDDQYVKEIEKYREEQNAEFLNPETSPLSASEIKSFQGHEHFPINEAYRVQARFEPYPEFKPF